MSEVLDLQAKYTKEIRPELSKELGGLNVHDTPRLDKVVINSGIGKIVNVRRAKSTGQQTEEEMVEDIIEGIALIAGQRPHLIRARKSISGFKLREGTATGLRVTLRGKKMYDFVARLNNVALPRMRDFRGIKVKAVDQNGNLTIGVKESSIFPEVPPSNKQWGLQVTLVTNTEDRKEALELFRKLGVPLQKEEK
ncbi:MAG: 50S ribosomal protein L5 [Candidatus Spechtbacterales bacterium]|nr:50S ribosomal protein L5 [Candidatus Spechtbacterales bacterium]